MHKQKYRHIFFDLDRTLWDMEKNSEHALRELYAYYRLEEYGLPPFDTFYKTYHAINLQLWKAYARQEISKEELRTERFYQTFSHFGLAQKSLAFSVGESYVLHAPYKPTLLPYAQETLAYLKKKYSLHIITNGFSEVQHIKLTRCGIRPYFTHIILSDEAGYLKPHSGIFQYALEQCRAEPEDCLMIGDDYDSDITGARNAGIDQVYLTKSIPEKQHASTYTIDCLSKLREVL